MSPMFPSWIRSRKPSPRFVYRLAIETTRRRLASIRRFFPSCAFISPSRMVWSEVRSASADMPTSRRTCCDLRRASRIASAASTTCAAGARKSRLAVRAASFSSARMRAACLKMSAAGWPSRCSRRRTSCWSASTRRCASFSFSTSICTCLAHLALAALDLLGDRDLLLAREEGHAAHLLEVHAHRVGGLAGRALGRFLGLGLLLGPLGLDRLFRLLGQRRLLDCRVDLDVHVAEHRDDVVELLGCRAVGGDLTLVARLGGGRRRPRRAGPGCLRLLLFDSLLLALHASPPRGAPGCGARVEGLRQGLSRCW